MNALILQNNVSVREVKPNTPIQLLAQNVGFWTGHLEFQVIDEAGNVILRQWVGTSMTQQAWLDWYSPSGVGNYRFYPDSGNYDVYVDFSVTQTAIIPTPGQPPITPTPLPVPTLPVPTPTPALAPTPGMGVVGATDWALWVAIGIGVIALLGASYLFIRRK